jgi:hypothetical protein
MLALWPVQPLPDAARLSSKKFTPVDTSTNPIPTSASTFFRIER